jgi:hypothetical protein
MLYLQTRSSAEDYTFFGDNPPHRWWSTRYQQFFEDGEFNVFVEITPPKWRAFVGGITGSRTDRIGRSIRYEFAGEGDRADADAAFFNHLLVFLLSGCQNSEAINKRLSSLTSLLDNKWFTQKFVDSLDKERQTDNTKKAIQERLMEIGRLLEEKVPISKFVANLTWSAGAYSLQWETISQFLSALQMLVAPAPSKSSGCLVITSLPLEKEQIMAFMRVFQVKYPDAKTLWLSSWEGYQAPDPTTTPIFRLPEPIQLPSPKPPPPPLPVSAPPSATPSSGDTQEKKKRYEWYESPEARWLIKRGKKGELDVTYSDRNGGTDYRESAGDSHSTEVDNSEGS